MSVLIDTSLGDLVLDLHYKECPKACLNFIKLCKMKYYNNCLFYNVQKDFITQSGDPANTGKNPTSLFGIIDGEKYKYFDDEINPSLRHNKLGTVSTANLGPNLNTSTFFVSLTDKNNHFLNGKHTIFGQIEEGKDVLEKINKAYCDKEGRPYQNIRIRHTFILEDPFEDPDGIVIPSNSPELVKDNLEYNRLEDDFNVDEFFKDKETEAKVQEKVADHEAKNRAIVLEMLEDLPDADIKPPDNVLFVCKINPVTQDDDLELIFSRFGPVKSCQIIRDWKTGESLQYAFVEFETVEACEEAFFKMDGVVIDERRIHVDFSQSVAKLWHNFQTSKKEESKLDDKNKELILPNEVQKFEIKNNKDFMIDKRNYRMVFDNDNKNNEDSKITFKYQEKRKRNHSPSDSNKKKSRSRSRKKHKSRSRSKERDRERDRERSPKRHKSRSRSRERKHNKDKYSDKHYDKHYERRDNKYYDNKHRERSHKY